MKGILLIKTAFGGKNEIIAINCDNFNYYKFIEAVKLVYDLPAHTTVEIYTNNFIIKPDLFIYIVEQYINAVDFIIEIKQCVLNGISTGISTYNSDVNIFLNNSSHTQLDLPETPPLVESLSPDLSEINFSENTSEVQTTYEIVNEQTSYSSPQNNLKDLPSTQEIKKLLEIQEALQSKYIENKHRTNIAKAIIALILNDNPDKKILREDFLQLSQAIVDIFPSEAKETYYVPFMKGHLAKGKLYDAYNNKRSRLSAAGAIRRRPKAKPEESLRPKRSIFEDNLETIFESDFEVLKIENHSDWDFILTQWKKSHLFRQQELETDGFTTAEYFFKYKILSNLKSFELFKIDFNILYPNAKNISEWKNVYKKLINKSYKLKDARVQEILQLISAAKDEVSIVALSLLLIPYNLPNCRQQSKGEIQQSFIYYCKNIFTADAEIRDRVNRLKIEGQPKIYFIGDSSKVICMSYVEICGKRLKFENPLQAVEVCFHCFMAINIKYPKYSNHVWLFVQLFIFQVNTPWDVIIPSVNTLIKDLRMETVQQIV